MQRFLGRRTSILDEDVTEEPILARAASVRNVSDELQRRPTSSRDKLMQSVKSKTSTIEAEHYAKAHHTLRHVQSMSSIPPPIKRIRLDADDIDEVDAVDDHEQRRQMIRLKYSASPRVADSSSGFAIVRTVSSSFSSSAAAIAPTPATPGSSQPSSEPSFAALNARLASRPPLMRSASIPSASQLPIQRLASVRVPSFSSSGVTDGQVSPSVAACGFANSASTASRPAQKAHFKRRTTPTA